MLNFKNNFIASLAALLALTLFTSVLDSTYPQIVRSIETTTHTLSQAAEDNFLALKQETLTQGKHTLLAGISFSEFIANSWERITDSVIEIFTNDEEKLLPAYKPTLNNASTPEETKPASVISPSIDISTLRGELIREMEAYVNQRLISISLTPTPVSPSTPVFNTTTLRSDILASDTYPAIRNQSDRDSVRNSLSIASVLDGGEFINASITTSTGSFSTLSGTTFTFTNATGTSLYLSGNAAIDGNLNVGSNTVTLGQLISTRVPTLAHVFAPSWPSGTSNASDATIYINPASAAPDTNIFAAAVNGQVKFLVDAEGDVYANNMILSGSTSAGETNIAGNLSVQDNSTFGDASTDITTFNSQLQALASTTLQNFTFTSATGTSATTTNLYAQIFNSQFSIFNEATTTSLAVTGSSQLGTVISGLWNGTAIGDSYLTKSGDWTGTFDSQEGTYYLARANHTGTQLASTISDFAAAADLRINATTTINTLTTLLGLTDTITTRATTTNATSTNLYAEIFTSPLATLTDTTITNLEFTLATGTSATTTNFFSTTASSTNLFSSLASIGGNAFNVVASGNVGVGSSTPFHKLSVNSSGVATDVFGVKASTGGSLIYYREDGDGDLILRGYNQSGTETLRFDTNSISFITGGNVGIGTTNPGAKLDVRDGNFVLTDADVAHGMTDFATTETSLQLNTYSGTTGGGLIRGISDTDNYPLQIWGVFGTTDPTDADPAINLISAKKNGTTYQALGSSESVFNIQNAGTNLVRVLGSGNVGIGTTNPGRALVVTSTLNPFISILEEGGNEIFKVGDTGAADSAQLAMYDGVTQAINLCTNSVQCSHSYINGGNLGIGTTNPAALFEAAGNDPRLFLTDNVGGPVTVQMLASNSVGWMGTYTNHPLRLRTNDTDVMTLLASGNVGVGTTNPGYRFSVDTRSGSPSYNGLYVIAGGNSSGSYTAYFERHSEGASMTLRGDGFPWVNQAWSVGSDRRLKENVVYLEGGGLDKVLNLKPVSFDYITGGKNNLGFVAQDVQEVIPEAVLVGNAETGMLSVKSDFIIPHLVNAVKEIYAEFIEFKNIVLAYAEYFFSREVETKLLCISNDNGEKTCITKEELDALLANAGRATYTTNNQQSPTDSTSSTDTATTTESVSESTPNQSDSTSDGTGQATSTEPVVEESSAAETSATEETVTTSPEVTTGQEASTEEPLNDSPSESSGEQTEVPSEPSP